MGSTDMETARGGGSAELAGEIARVRAARNPEARLRDGRRLLEFARAHCAGPVEIAAMSEAADALLAATQAPDDFGPDRRSLITIAHDFIDLARLKSVRKAAYPAEAGSLGGRWLDRIIQLIDRTDFTVGRMFRQRSAQYREKTLFAVPQWDLVTEYSWDQVVRTTQQIACGVLALLGDDPRVAIFTPNRIEGVLFDLACLTNGIFDTMVPANVVDSQIEYILVESGARMLVVSGPQQVQMAFAALGNVLSLEWVVTLDALPGVPGAKVITLDKLLNLARDVPVRALEERIAGVRSSDLATTMYTSGTTGTPKGIKFTHLNLVSKRFARAAALPRIDDEEVLVCYLPLYHTFGRYLEMLGTVHLAGTYVFAGDSSTETLIRQMRRLRPTGLIGVPKKWLDLHRRIAAADEPSDNSGDLRHTVGELTGGRLRWGLSAAGRLSPSVFRFFQNAGIDLLSGYGMTEATGGITMTPPGEYVDDSIGKALPAIDLALDDDNELLLRGPYVSGGYADPQEDATAFRDGWFCTGDIVARDTGGYLTHVDRKKDIYKSASGRTIAPQRIEGLFADLPEISSVFAVGDGRNYMTLLIRPNPGYSEVAFENMPDTTRREYFRGLVASCNRFLAPFERVVNFALIDREFSLERGELTPKGSFRRSVVEQSFRDVIEGMYVSSAIERMVDGLRVSIPIAFLQHLGVTEPGTRADGDGLVFPAIERKLRVQRDRDAADRVWIGNCCYDAIGEEVNLDDWLRLPELWVGNADLTHISGESILLWSLSEGDRLTRSRMVGVRPPGVSVDEWNARFTSCRDAAPNLLTLHAAAVMLFSGARGTALQAIGYLAQIMKGGRVRYEELAASRLQQASSHPDRAVRSRAFAALWESQPAVSFGLTASLFCGSLLDFLDAQACERIASSGITPGLWQPFREALGRLRRGVAGGSSDQAAQFILGLFRSLGRIADLCDDNYLPVRQELMAWMLAPVSPSIRQAALETTEEMQASFRRKLGQKRSRATDPGTGRDFGWGETVRMEDGIDPQDRLRITKAIQETELVREAAYLLHHKQRIDLTDLSPRNIWVSLIGMRFGRSVYHVGVRLRDNQRCDFVLYVRNTAPPETFLTDLRLMGLAAGTLGEPPLTPQLVGHWPEYDIATIEHISGESIESLAGHMHEDPDVNVRKRLKQAWKHLLWSALIAAFELYRRTDGRWMLRGTTSRDITVPLNDFEGDARVFSTAGWCRFEGNLNMILGLKRAFLDRIRFHFPALTAQTEDELIFAAAVEACGIQEGLAFLKDAVAEGSRTRGSDEPEVIELCRGMDAFVKQVGETGYMPKSLYFAIERYREWSAQVPEAGLHARAAQLRQIQVHFRIDAESRRFPGARLRLYAETVLKDSSKEGREIIEQAIGRLREGWDVKKVLGQLHQNLRNKLPSHDEQYFLTRAAYPHLDPDEKAQLVSTAEVGSARAELVTVCTDLTGRELHVRPVADSFEMDTLYRAFYAGGISGVLSAHENYLVAVDDAGYVVGGIAYVRRTPSHSLLDRIVVLPRCRGKGIGSVLLGEFLRRQTAEGVAVVSAQLIRAGWLSQFGFRPHPRYAGVVLCLAVHPEHFRERARVEGET